MKNLMKWMMSIAMVAISFTGCENNIDESSPADKGFELTVVTDNVGSRTEYDADLMDIKWSTGDQAQVLVKGTYANVNATIDAADPRIASFTWAPGTYITNVTAGTHIVQGYAPQKSYASCTYDASGAARTCATRLGLKLPAAQSASTTTFDKVADILVADNMSVEITEEDLTVGNKTVAGFHFRRMVAISEFTYKVTNSTLAASDEQVASVAFEVVAPNKDKYIAGNMYIKPTEEGAQYVNANNEELTDSKNYFYESKSSKVQVSLADQPALAEGFTAWVVTSPITLEADDQLIFTVTTTAGTVITKTIEAVGREVSFSTTKKNTLTVTLDDTVAIKEAAASDAITPGNYALLVLHSNKYLALSANNGTSSNRRASTNVTDKYTAGDELFTTNDEDLVWTIVEAEGGYHITYGGKYLTATSGENYATLGTTADLIKFVKLEDGSYQIISTKDTTDQRNLALNSGVGSGEFAFYKTSTTSSSSSYAYKVMLVPATFVATPELAVKNQPAKVAAAGATVTVELVAKNLTETVTATPSVDWITNATVSGANLNFTVAANESAEERSATIALACGELTATVTVTQAAKAADGGTPVEKSLSFASTAQRTSQNSTKQVWEQNGITFVNDKASSSSAVANYSNPVRCYAGSSITITATGKITKVVFVANSTSYATAMKNSIGTVSGASVSISGSDVTITYTDPVEECKVAKLTAQVRLNSLNVTYLE